MRRILAGAVIAGLAWGCGGRTDPSSIPEGDPTAPAGGGSPNARRENIDIMRQDLAAPRHASDGGGRAWLDGAASDAEISAGRSGRWTIVYEAGEHGIAEGGMIFLLVSPFWGWSEPQTATGEAFGYTTATTDADGVTLATSVAAAHLVGITIEGRALEPGERVRIVYGDGAAGARPDRFAEGRERLWIAVDGDGDGHRATLVDSPVVRVTPGPARRLVATITSTAQPGDPVRLTVAVLDGAGNAGIPIAGVFRIDGIDRDGPPGGVELPERIALEESDLGRKTVSGTARSEGIYRLRVALEGGEGGPDVLSDETNPLVVDSDGLRVLWGDLQIHSGISDGTGTPADIYTYARDVAGLDVAALTDHDHWGTLFLDQHEFQWDEIREAARTFHEPGRFVTFLGYEWTSWIHGHRHVLYPGDDGEVFAWLDPATDEPPELWDALRPHGAMTIPHHTAGDPVAVNWEFPPDPDLEHVAEIVSVHGSSEAADSPSVVSGALRGHFVRDALDRGYVLGFVGSTDGHDGHPGLGQITSRTGGLAGILSEELTREAVFEAIRQRRTYATSGARIVLRVSLGGRRMGSLIDAPAPSEALNVFAVGERPLRSVDVVRSGRVVESHVGGGAADAFVSTTVEGLEPGEYLYVRVVQSDGQFACSSPFFVREGTESSP